MPNSSPNVKILLVPISTRRQLTILGNLQTLMLELKARNAPAKRENEANKGLIRAGREAESQISAEKGGKITHTHTHSFLESTRKDIFTSLVINGN